MSGPRAPDGYDTSLKAPRLSSKSHLTCPAVRGGHLASGESSELKHGVAARIWRREVSGPGWVHTDRTM